MRNTLVLWLVFFTICAACNTATQNQGSKSRCATTTGALTFDGAGPVLSGSKNQGMLLTTTQDYTSSRLYYFDFATGKRAQILSGESGDPGLFTSRDETFFFNRGAENSNLRSLGVNSQTFELGVQTAMPGAGSGDPHAILHLDDRHLLMSFWAAHGLGIFDLEACALIKTVNLDFDIGDSPDQVFRPSSLFTQQSTGDTEFYIVHQGLAADGISVTGTQQIFVLTWDGTELTAKDLNSEKEKIQGIPLRVSNPTAIFQDNDTIIVVGSCTIYSNAGCVSGFEQVNLEGRSTNMIFDTSARPEKYNGGLARKSSGVYYAQLLIPDTDASVSGSEKFLSLIDTAAGTVTKVYSYPADSGGYGQFFFDDVTESLIFTDYTQSGGGKISVLDKEHKLTQEIAIENIPYAGILTAN